MCIRDTGIIMLIALGYYLFRRFASPYKDISVPEDFILIILLIGIVGLGAHMRFFGTVHTEMCIRDRLKPLFLNFSLPE